MRETIICSCLFLFISCSGGYTSKQLAKAEDMMNQYPDSALPILQSALCHSQKVHNAKRAIYNLQEIGKTFVFMEQPDSASLFFEQAVSQIDQADDKLKSVILHNIGVSYFDSGELDKALHYLLSSNESLRTKVLERELEKSRLFLLMISSIMASTLIILLIVIVVRRTNRRIRLRHQREIADKEIELDKYQSQLDTLNKKEDQNKTEREKLFFEKRELEKNIEKLKDEISKYNRIPDNNASDEEQIRSYLPFIKGLKLCIHALYYDKPIFLQNRDYQHFIDFYRHFDNSFVIQLELKKYHLTDHHKVICILFRMRLEHQHIADLLGINSESLSRTKTRIKNKKLKINSSCKLENFICEL